MHLNSALDHRDCPTVAVVESDDYPLGEHPPVTWWQVQNIPYAVIVSEAVIAAIGAALDLLSVSLFGKPWSELVDQSWQPMQEWFE